MSAAIDLKPLAPPPSPPPQQQKVPLLPPPAFDDDADDDAGGPRGGRRRTPLPAPPPPFQRQSAGRCSVQQPMMKGDRHCPTGNCPVVSEYFIPRSASAHDLCSSVDARDNGPPPPPPPPPSALRTAAATLARPPRPQTARDKVVTFEDERLAHHDQQQRYRSSGDLIV